MCSYINEKKFRKNEIAIYVCKKTNNEGLKEKKEGNILSRSQQYSAIRKVYFYCH